MTAAIAIISVATYLAAAAVAVSLVRLTRLRWVWVFLASATVLLAAERVVHLANRTSTISDCLVQLLIALLVLAAMVGIRLMCRAFHSSVETLKVAQAELEAARRRLGFVLDSAPIVLFAVDKDGVFTLSEGRGLEGLGLKPGEVVGRSAFEVYHNNPDIISNINSYNCSLWL